VVTQAGSSWGYQSHGDLGAVRRPALLWRKGSFGSNSEAGSRFAEWMRTEVATCRQ